MWPAVCFMRGWFYLKLVLSIASATAAAPTTTPVTLYGTCAQPRVLGAPDAWECAGFYEIVDWQSNAFVDAWNTTVHDWPGKCQSAL